MLRALEVLSLDPTNKVSLMRSAKAALCIPAFEYLEQLHATQYDWNWCAAGALSVEDRMTPLTYAADQLPRHKSLSLDEVVSVIRWLIDHGAKIHLLDGNELTMIGVFQSNCRYGIEEPTPLGDRYRDVYSLLRTCSDDNNWSPACTIHKISQ